MSHDLEPKTTIETPSVEEARHAFTGKTSSLEKFKGKRQVAFISGIAIGLAGLGFGAQKIMSESVNNAPEPNTQPSVEAPVVPGEPTAPSDPETQTPVEIAPETLRLSADLPAEELARQSVDLVNDWMFAGATEETIEATAAEQIRLIQEEGIGFEQAFTYMAEENADYYTKAVMVDDWENNPEAVEFHQYMVDRNAKAIQVALTRHTNNEPLITWDVEVSDVQELERPEGKRSIQYISTITAHNDESVPTPVSLMNVRGFDTTSGSALLFDESSNQLDGFN